MDNTMYIFWHDINYVNVQTCEVVYLLGDQFFSFEGLLGAKIFLPEETVEELCKHEDAVNNYLANQGLI